MTFTTGARQGQALKLLWEDVDLENGAVRLWTRKTGRRAVARCRSAILTDDLIAEQSASLEAACGQKPLILSSASGLNVDRALRMIVRGIDKDKEDAANQVPAPEQEGWHP